MIAGLTAREPPETTIAPTGVTLDTKTAAISANDNPTRLMPNPHRRQKQASLSPRSRPVNERELQLAGRQAFPDTSCEPHRGIGRSPPATENNRLRRLRTTNGLARSGPRERAIRR